MQVLQLQVCLLLQAHFRQLKPSKTTAQLAAQREGLLQQVPEAQRKSITDEVINQALGMDMVSRPCLPISPCRTLHHCQGTLILKEFRPIGEKTSLQVEHVALLSNATDNNFTGVTMYCDDEAVAVGLPVNVRASEIAGCAGCPAEASCIAQHPAWQTLVHLSNSR